MYVALGSLASWVLSFDQNALSQLNCVVELAKKRSRMNVVWIRNGFIGVMEIMRGIDALLDCNRKL